MSLFGNKWFASNWFGPSWFGTEEAAVDTHDWGDLRYYDYWVRWRKERERPERISPRVEEERAEKRARERVERLKESVTPATTSQAELKAFNEEFRRSSQLLEAQTVRKAEGLETARLRQLLTRLEEQRLLAEEIAQLRARVQREGDEEMLLVLLA